MKRTSNSLDGFVPRRSGAELGKGQRPLSRPRASVGNHNPQTSLQTAGRVDRSKARADIDDSLRQIDNEVPGPVKKRRLLRRKPKKSKKLRTRFQKWRRRIILFIILVLVGVGAYLGFSAFIASGNIFSGNPFGLLQNKPLKMDANGRSNILVFGTSEDDPGHKGAGLTDSIMLVSVDQNKNKAALLSVPRDLYVDYGQVCPEGFQGRINSLYECVNNDDKNEAAGAQALMKKVGDVFGVDIQYYAHLNYSVVRDSVNAVGGINVKIESDDPRGILDRNFDWKCDYKCYYVKYKKDEVARLDGEHALALARARGAAGGYGLPNANFDREKNQQKIIRSLRAEAVSAGTLANVAKVKKLIDALGNNLRTNFDTSEIQTLMSLGTDIPNEAITSLTLIGGDNELVTNGNIGGASIVQPSLGLYEYGDIQAYVKKKLSNNPVIQEEARIVIMNASTTSGVAQTQADLLDAEGFTISAVTNAPAGDYAPIEIYQIASGKSATRAKLESFYGVTVKTTTSPVQVAAGTNFVIIFGKDPSSAAG